MLIQAPKLKELNANLQELTQDKKAESAGSDTQESDSHDNQKFLISNLILDSDELEALLRSRRTIIAFDVNSKLKDSTKRHQSLSRENTYTSVPFEDNTPTATGHQQSLKGEPIKPAVIANICFNHFYSR
ncbi:unnamed protein product [Hermetia illucens]|uniref:Uncharacterized protein n=1 Tax=Hermetia illucens TaxID=343691 RepID=A0A7R8YPR1_HERIL|nr:unnamed protein product [Hermetia illucens]